MDYSNNNNLNEKLIVDFDADSERTTTHIQNLGLNNYFDNTGNDINTDYPNKKEETMSLTEVMKTCLYLGVSSFGGPIAHIGMFNQTLIKDKKIISEKEFTELFAICNVIPGPTSSQLLTAIATIKTKSILGGIISFLCFNMPALIVMIAIASIVTSTTTQADASISIFFPGLNGIAVGIWQGAVALVLQAALTLNKRVSSSNIQSGILVLSGIIYFFFNYYYVMVVLMLIAGVISVYNKESEFLIKRDDSIKIDEQISFIGLPALLTLIFTYTVILVINGGLYSGGYTQLIEVFFRIGASVIGGGHVVIPLIFAEFRNIIPEKEILNALSIVSILPGPMFNIAGYIGTIYYGALAGFLSAISIFFPGMLILFTALKFIAFINEHPGLQFFLRGVSSASIGFIFTSCAVLWYDSCYKNSPYHFIFGTVNIAVAYVLISEYKLNVVAALGISALYSIFIIQVGI